MKKMKMITQTITVLLSLVSTYVISTAYFERIFDEFAAFFFFFYFIFLLWIQYKVRIADTLLFRECSIKGPFLQIPFVPTIFLLFFLLSFPFFRRQMGAGRLLCLRHKFSNGHSQLCVV